MAEFCNILDFWADVMFFEGGDVCVGRCLAYQVILQKREGSETCRHQLLQTRNQSEAFQHEASSNTLRLHMNKDSRTFPKLQGFTTRSNLSLSLNEAFVQITSSIDQVRNCGKKVLITKRPLSLPERKAAAWKSVSSLYARVQHLILRHSSGTVHQSLNLVSEHEMQKEHEGKNFKGKVGCQENCLQLICQSSTSHLRHSRTVQNLVPKHEGKIFFLCNMYENYIL